MANPQKEDGFTPIANEIVEAFARTSISGHEWRVLWIILRQTYGWQRKEDPISLSQIAKRTGISVPCVCRAVRKLLAKGIVATDQNDSSGITTYRLIKNYEKWHLLTKKSVPPHLLTKKSVPHCPKSQYGVLTKQSDIKETLKERDKEISISHRQPKKAAQKKRHTQVEYTKQFDEQFWAKYPKEIIKDNGEKIPFYFQKPKAMIQFAKLNQEQKGKAIEFLELYLKNNKFPKSPINYLKEKLWELVNWDEFKNKKTQEANHERRQIDPKGACISLHGGDYSEYEKNATVLDIDEPEEP